MTLHQHNSEKMQAEPAASAFGAFVVSALPPGSFPQDLMQAGKRALLDCLASAVSGADEVVVRKLLEIYGDAAPAQASIIAHGGKKLPGEIAALINGAMGHATDYDDVSFEMWGHATAPALPAVLAAAEEKSMSGLDFLRAFVIGLEVEIKLGASVAPNHYAVGWHPTSTIGVFGAAAGAAAAGGLSAEQSATALCIAASRSAGLRANFGSLTKAMHVGFAARDGYVSALLARNGFTAQNAALDGAFGFIDVMSAGKNAIEEKIRRLGQPFELLEPGLAYKYYPSCSDTHIAVDTLIELLAHNGISAAEIARIRCGVTSGVKENLIFDRPRSGLERKFSMHYCLAVAAVNGTLTLADFADSAPVSEDVRELMARVEMYVDDTIDSSTYCSNAHIELQTQNGTSFSREGSSAMGHPGRELSDAQLAEKFRGCASGIFSESRTSKLIEMIGRIEEIDSVGLLMSALSR